ncbi:protein kinase domain-containing protein [Kitasatospora azatica]|uniref:protein kinase domain-containing protein n=1 Tax=Kitasatospora azatica TaxID=58347 RepID=UPI000691589A|nr:protein kinase [Kitasatospora azatica]
MIGRALNGRYELVGTLGAGGMATVYHGVDRVLGREVAVKILNGGLAEDPRFAERFGREAQHAAMLVHPRIAMVFDSGMDQGSPYIVMELIRGRSLGSVLAEGGPLPVERAVGIAAAVCEALEVAHAAGLVHRDIKPGNVMITDDGGVKVVDFGIARASASGQQLTQTATVLGTAAYLSPEQATAGEVDGRADLYALGCVLTEMLTGEPPFTADTPVAIAFKQVTEEAAPVSRRRPELPPALDLIVARLLAKRPQDRPATAAAARAELLAAVPVAGAVDRTAELLAMTAPGPAGAGDRTALLPPTPGHRPAAAHTSVMAPLPPHSPEQYQDAPEPRRSGRTLGLVLGGVGLAAAGLIGVLVSSNSAAGNGAGQPRAGHSESAAAPPAAASASSSPTAPSPSPGTARPTPASPAAAIAALRAEMVQAQLPKDRQAPLLKTLDAATAALVGQQPQDAVVALKAEQRQVRDLSKKHAVDNQTAASWQRQLASIITSLNADANNPDNPDNGGN